MEKTLKLLLSLGVLLVAFWFGMQWGARTTTSPMPVVQYRPAPQMSTLPETSTTVTPDTTTPATPPTETDVNATDGTPAVVTPTAAVSSLPALSSTEKIAHYENTNFKYAFDMPAKVFYSGFGATADARHTVGIGLAAVPDTLDTSDVQVSFYGKKSFPELQNGDLFIDPAGKYVLKSVNGYVFRITGFDTHPTIVSRIAQTVTVQE